MSSVELSKQRTLTLTPCLLSCSLRKRPYLRQRGVVVVLLPHRCSTIISTIYKPLGRWAALLGVRSQSELSGWSSSRSGLTFCLLHQQRDPVPVPDVDFVRIIRGKNAHKLLPTLYIVVAGFGTRQHLTPSNPFGKLGMLPRGENGFREFWDDGKLMHSSDKGIHGGDMMKMMMMTVCRDWV